MSSKNIKNLIHYSKDGIISKQIFRSSKIDVTLFCMAKGTEMSEHTSAKEGIVHVLEGKGEFTLNGKKIKMEPGAMMHMEKKAPHSLKAKENTSFVLILAN